MREELIKAGLIKAGGEELMKDRRKEQMKAGRQEQIKAPTKQRVGFCMTVEQALNVM